MNPVKQTSQENKTKAPMNTWLKQGVNLAMYSGLKAGLDTAGYAIQKTQNQEISRRI